MIVFSFCFLSWDCAQHVFRHDCCVIFVFESQWKSLSNASILHIQVYAESLLYILRRMVKKGVLVALISRLDDWPPAWLLWCSVLLRNATQLRHSVPGKTHHVSSSAPPQPAYQASFISLLSLPPSAPVVEIVSTRMGPAMVVHVSFF